MLVSFYAEEIMLVVSVLIDSKFSIHLHYGIY